MSNMLNMKFDNFNALISGKSRADTSDDRCVFELIIDYLQYITYNRYMKYYISLNILVVLYNYVYQW